MWNRLLYLNVSNSVYLLSPSFSLPFCLATTSKMLYFTGPHFEHESDYDEYLLMQRHHIQASRLLHVYKLFLMQYLFGRPFFKPIYSFFCIADVMKMCTFAKLFQFHHGIAINFHRSFHLQKKCNERFFFLSDVYFQAMGFSHSLRDHIVY